MYYVSKSHRRAASASNTIAYSANSVDYQKMMEYMEYYNKFSRILYTQNQRIHNIQCSYQHSNQIHVDDIFQHPVSCPRTPFSLKATEDEDNFVYTDRDDNEEEAATLSNRSFGTTESTNHEENEKNDSKTDELLYADEDLCLDDDEKNDLSFVNTSSRNDASSDDHVPISPIEQILTQNLQIEQNSHFASQACKKARRNMYHQRGKSVSYLDNHGFYDDELADESDDGAESNYVLTTILESSMGSKKKNNSTTISKNRLYNSTPRNMNGFSFKKHIRNNLDSYKNKKNTFQVDTSRYQDLFARNLLFLQEKQLQITDTQHSLEIANV